MVLYLSFPLKTHICVKAEFYKYNKTSINTTTLQECKAHVSFFSLFFLPKLIPEFPSVSTFMILECAEEAPESSSHSKW